ncbi:MAG: NAD-dependent epimerase/dehydratase family protein, partial [Actinobacteria bacterium]|nr:NAD-dependent epimerase/dehydratase family protein [Actinomycetota bacterium]
NIDTQNLSAVCAHIFYVYGPHEHPDRLVPTIIRRLLRGEEVRVLPPREKRDYLYVKDVASALCALLDHETSGGVDICAGTDIELGDLFRTIEEITGRERLIIVGGHEGRTERVPRGDVTRIKSTGWRPRFSLRQGIQESVEWWERQPIR